MKITLARLMLPLLLAATFSLAACGDPEPEPEPAQPAPTAAPVATAAPTPSPTPSPTPTPEPTPEPFGAASYLARLADDPPSSVRMFSVVEEIEGLPAGVSITVETVSVPAHAGRQTLGLDVLLDGEPKARIDLLLEGEFIYINPPGTNRWLRTKREDDSAVAEVLPIADQTTGFFGALPDPDTMVYTGESDCDGVPCHILEGEKVTLQVRIEDEVPIRFLTSFEDGTPVVIDITGWDEGHEVDLPDDARDVPASSFWQLVITIISSALV